MKTEGYENTGSRIGSATKYAMAMKAINKQKTITAIAKDFTCSRTTVHAQKNRALEAAAKAFDQSDEETVLTFPMTQPFIHKMVVSLFCIVGASYRAIMFFFKNVFDVSLSLGAIFSILDEAADKAVAINEKYQLNSIETSAADEVFHRNAPILSVVDISSRFCALLAKANERDYETWGIHLLDLQERGYAPNTTIIDGAKGLIKGHAEALPKTALRHDHFHFIRDLKDCARYLKNQVASTTTATFQLIRRAEKEQDAQKKTERTVAAATALTALNALEETHQTFALLAQWLQHDVLQLSGYAPEVRATLYDFIVTEMRILAERHPHRIDAIVTSLAYRRDALLEVANALNAPFAQLAMQYNVSIDTIWEICYTTRYSMDHCTYHERSCALEEVIGKCYDAIEDAVLAILEKTHRCSSMVENFHSRLRPYLDERKSVRQKTLGLLQFYLNHKPFMRSEHEHLKNKSPAHALTGKPHLPWLEMLGFPCFKRQTT